MRLQILKLGGSVVTYKDQVFSPHIENITRLAEEIKKSDSKRLVIVHGGGSYGHPVAKQYDIANGFNYPEQIIGFSKTHQAMVEINKIIVEAFLKIGLPAFSISASSMLTTEAKRLKKLDISIVKRLLELGMIPVLYGDAVLDLEQGFAILSGDQLIVQLAKKLHAERVIFGSDVDGIFTSNPKMDENAELIRVFSLRNIDANVGDTTNTDVTGGMKGKLTEAGALVNQGVEVVFINAYELNRVRDALRGEKVMGTILTL